MISWLINPLLRRMAKGKIVVLGFHDILNSPDPLQPDAIDAAHFELMLDWIQENFEVVNLEDALKDSKPSTKPRASLTFDDGYPSWVEVVMPKLLKRGMHATFFVTTAGLDEGIHWHQRITRIVRAIPEGTCLKVDGLDLELDGRTLRARRRSSALLERLLKPKRPAERKKILNRLEAQISPMGGESALDRESLRLLSSSGFAIGAHSCHHPLLSKISLVEAENEITESQSLLSQEIGRSIRGFAYPNGQPGIDFDERHVELVRRAGFKFAVTTLKGSVRPDDERLLLKRFTPWGKTKQAWTRQTILHCLLER